MTASARRVAARYSIASSGIRLMGASEFHSLVNEIEDRRGSRTDVPFLGSDDFDWRFPAEQRGRYLVGFDRGEVVAAFKFYRGDSELSQTNAWLVGNGLSPIIGSLYSGAYIGVSPARRRQGWASRLNEAMLGLLAPGDVFRLGSHEPDGKELNRAWLSHHRADINVLYGNRYAAYAEYDPARVNYVVTDVDYFGRLG